MSNHLIRKITSGGVVTTLAGQAGVTGSTDGTGTAASFYYPTGVAVDTSGNIYVADNDNNLIRKITSGGVVTTLAGQAGVTGSTNGTGNAASFHSPQGIAVDTSGNVYVADAGNNLIRKITSGGVVTTFAGSGSPGSTNGTGTTSSFLCPTGVAIDASGNVYVADMGNDLIRKITQ
jgi:secreted PhoX family phosphatase